MREAGRVVHAVLNAVEAACGPGGPPWTSTASPAGTGQRRAAARPFVGYAPGGAPPYPAVLCTSRNHVVVHGIPSRDVVLAEGDILGIDFACFKEGYCADAARTVAVGVISAPRAGCWTSPARRWNGPSPAAPRITGCRTSAPPSRAMAAANGYSVVRELVGPRHRPGHARGAQVPNYGKRRTRAAPAPRPGHRHRADAEPGRPRGAAPSPTGGPSSPTTAASRRTSSTASPSPMTAR